MTVTLRHSVSAAGTQAVLIVAVLSTLVNHLSDVVSAQCVECQLLLSHAAHQPPGIVIIIIIIIIMSVVCLPLTCLHDDDKGRLVATDTVSYTHLTLPTIYSV